MTVRPLIRYRSLEYVDAGHLTAAAFVAVRMSVSASHSSTICVRFSVVLIFGFHNGRRRLHFLACKPQPHAPIFIGLYHRQPSVGYLVCDSMPDAVMARITKALKIGHIELRAASIDRDDEQSDGLVLSGVAAATQNITGKQFRIQAGHTRPSSAWCD